MNKEEAKARIEAAQSAIADAERELAAAKAALTLSEQEPACGRTVMKPSEVPAGEYFRYVDEEYAFGETCYKFSAEFHATRNDAYRMASKYHDHKPVYLTDPYGNAIEPCEELPGDFLLEGAIESLSRPKRLAYAFSWGTTNEGHNYWGAQVLSGLTPDAKAKLRGMIHKWNQENGGQG